MSSLCCPEDAELKWKLRSLRTAFKDIATSGPTNMSLCLFIDALDECDKPIKELISFFNELKKDSRLNIKICFSSRNLSDDLLSTFRLEQGFMIQDQNSEDIVNFVNDKLSSNISIDKSESDLIHYQDLMILKEEIIHKADGVFLWVRVP